MQTVLSFLLSLVLLSGCAGEKSADSASTDTETTNDVNSDYGDPETAAITTGDEIADASVCDEVYSFCGNLYVPQSLTGDVRQLVVALYKEIPPTGSPDLVVTQIDNPTVVAGEKYPIRIYPFLDSGEYYIWVNMYMMDGGEYQPVNDVDYTGHSEEMVMLEGGAFKFDDILLDLASGW